MPTVQITNAGVNLIRDALRGVVASDQIKYVAIGTGSTAPTAGDTQLQAETFRKAMTSTSNGANPGEGLFTMALSPQDAVGTAIAEVGWFGGPSASATPGSGVLLGRALYSHNKTGKESLNLQFDLTV